jgi:hypothetical protein
MGWFNRVHSSCIRRPWPNHLPTDSSLAAPPDIHNGPWPTEARFVFQCSDYQINMHYTMLGLRRTNGWPYSPDLATTGPRLRRGVDRDKQDNPVSNSSSLVHQLDTTSTRLSAVGIGEGPWLPNRAPSSGMASSAGDSGRSPPTLLLSWRRIPSCDSRQHELMVRWSWSSRIFTRLGSGHIVFGWQNPSGFHGSVANPSEPEGRGAPARAGPPAIDLEQRRWAASTWKRLTWVAHMAMAVTSRERESDWHRGSMCRRSGAGNVDADLGQFGPKTIQWRPNSFSFLFCYFFSILFSFPNSNIQIKFLSWISNSQTQLYNPNSTIFNILLSFHYLILSIIDRFNISFFSHFMF